MTTATSPAGGATRAAPTPTWRRRFSGPFVQRIGMYALTLVGAVSVNFIIPRVMPGDPTQETVQRLEVQTGQPVAPETEAAIRAMLGGNDDNLVAAYFTYWRNLLQGDFGLSTSYYPLPVKDLLLGALPWTLGLVVVSMIVAWLVGVSLGAIAGWWRGRPIDTVIGIVCAVLIAVPSFWAALMLQYFLGYRLGWLPPGGAYDPDLVPGFSSGFVLSCLKYGALPGITLAVISFAGYMFTMRNVLAQTAAEDSVLLAQAKGLSPVRVMVGYGVRNSILPSFAALAQTIGGAIGGVLLIEVIFTYPGLGSLLGTALAGRDYPLIQGVFLIVTCSVLLMNFIADSVYGYIDPRTRESRE
ncbi:ABC transporter permease [Tsukamurella tyrosinosolvens]|nr:ABC transporter permease [Tsukamurella tyrosinosolvens]